MILIAGIGNIFLGDDGFGSEAARRIASRMDSPRVRVVDFGIRGLDFAYALMDGGDATIIVDAVQRGAEPGTIYVIEPDLDAIDDAEPAIDAHTMDPMRVLAFARSMGAELRNVTVVGCEPETLDGLGLSPTVAAAVENAVAVVNDMVRTLSSCTSYRSL